MSQSRPDRRSPSPRRPPSAGREAAPALFDAAPFALAATVPAEPAEPFDAVGFGRALAAWFQRAQRDLPWRRPENARDPYRVLVSEIMLQQTTVTAVVPFYERFLARFPTLDSLAAAALDEVLPLWAGLGYYSRARNLHALARAVAERHGGEFPHSLAAVLALPGVGRYTAGAVTSIAFDAAAPIVDANVARVFSRIFLIEGDLKARANQERLWCEATQLVESCGDGFTPSVLNPALMELGALICTPRSPRCLACPVARYCAARAAGRQGELPHATPRPAVVEVRDTCVFITRDMEKTAAPEAPVAAVPLAVPLAAAPLTTAPFAMGKPLATGKRRELLLRRRSHDAKIWWRGMWELPRITAAEGETSAAAAARLLRDEFALEAGGFQVGAKLSTVAHGVTHHHITLDCYGAQLAPDAYAALSRREGEALGWFGWDDIEALALPAAMRLLLRRLRNGSNE